jgi:hypothetical protein
MRPYDVYRPPSAGQISGWAIASLVVGILGLVVLGVIFGIVALVKIRDYGQKGLGMAIAGIVLSGVWAVVAVVLVAASHIVGTPNGQVNDNVDGAAAVSSAADASGLVNVHALTTGNCFNWADNGQPVASVTLIPCLAGHNAQVFAVWQLSSPSSSYPGNTYQVAAQGCEARKASLTAAASSLEVADFNPGPAGWADGDRVVYCLIISPAAELNSSLLNEHAGSNVSLGTRAPSAVDSSGVIVFHGLAAGNCFDWTDNGQPVGPVTLIPCGKAHNAQVFAVWELSSPSSSYPGNTYQVAVQGCQARRASLVASASSLEVTDLNPASADWADGDRVVYCLIISPTADLNSSLLKGKAGKDAGDGAGAPSAVDSSGVMDSSGLTTGNCFDWTYNGQPVASVTLIPCGQAHNAQVFAVWELSGSSYPGNESQVAVQGCQARRAASLIAPASSLGASAFPPSQAGWTDGDRVVQCVIVSPTADLTTSLLAS